MVEFKNLEGGQICLQMGEIFNTISQIYDLICNTKFEIICKDEKSYEIVENLTIAKESYYDAIDIINGEHPGGVRHMFSRLQYIEVTMTKVKKDLGL